MSPLILWALSMWAVLTFSGWGPPHLTHTRPAEFLLTNHSDTKTELTEGLNFKDILSPLWRFWVFDLQPTNVTFAKEESRLDFSRTPLHDWMWKDKKAAPFRQARNTELLPLSRLAQTDRDARIDTPKTKLEEEPKEGSVDAEKDYTSNKGNINSNEADDISKPRGHKLPIDIYLLLISLFCFIGLEAYSAMRRGVFTKICRQLKVKTVMESDKLQGSIRDLADRILECEMEKYILDGELERARNNLLGVHQKLLSLQLGCPPPPSLISQAGGNTRLRERRRILIPPDNQDTARKGFSPSWYRIRTTTKSPAQPEVSLRRRQRRFGPLAINLPHGD